VFLCADNNAGEVMKEAKLRASILGLLLLLTSPVVAQQADWDAVVAAAKKEGKLTIYNGTGFAFMGKLAEQFQKTYGIQTDVLVGRATEIRERLRTEQTSGRFIADINYSGNTTIRAQQVEEKILAPHPPLPLAKTIEAPLLDDGVVVPTNVGSYGILVNTSEVAAADAPKSWQDVTNPKWKGKILSDDMRVAGAGQAFFQGAYTAFGRGFHEKLAMNDLVVSRNFQESSRRVARGEYPLYVPFNISEWVGLKGLPLKLVLPEEGLIYIMLGMTGLKNAPHPNAAALFMNFSLELESQALVAREGFKPVVGNLGDRVPPEIAAINRTRLLATTDPARTNEMLKLASEIYK
jgi:iron(III) transport system substrate-binding protein